MTTETLIIFLILVVGAGALLLWSRRHVTTIYPSDVGLLYRNGQFQRELAASRYVSFDPFRRSRIVKVSVAALPVTLPEFNVISLDQFSFRVGLSPILKVVDARVFAESQPIAEPTIYAQFMPQAASHVALFPLVASAALEAVSTRGLRDVLADPTTLTDDVRAKLASAIPGAAIEKILMTSITLPPETRKMFTEVERSKLEAEASLERARGEQASLRVLSNAARLIKDNPALANLRFLHTLEQAPGAKTIVVGSDAVAPFTGKGG